MSGQVFILASHSTIKKPHSNYYFVTCLQALCCAIPFRTKTSWSTSSKNHDHQDKNQSRDTHCSKDVLAEQQYTHNVSANLRSLVKVIFVSDIGKGHEGPKTFRLPHFKVIARGRDGQCTNEQFQFANWASAQIGINSQIC